MDDLKARLDEDEARARQIQAELDEGYYDDLANLVRRVADPERALREVAAKRVRLAAYLEAAAEAERFPHGANVMVRDALLAVVRTDAEVYSPVPPDAVDRM